MSNRKEDGKEVELVFIIRNSNKNILKSVIYLSILYV